jgi:hypothetical protein
MREEGSLFQDASQAENGDFLEKNNVILPLGAWLLVGEGASGSVWDVLGAFHIPMGFRTTVKGGCASGS